MPRKVYWVWNIPEKNLNIHKISFMVHNQTDGHVELGGTEPTSQNERPLWN